MKKSILIAICDFLILSALSLSNGFKSAPPDVAPIVTQGISIQQSDNGRPDVESFEASIWSKYHLTKENLELISAKRDIASLEKTLSEREKTIGEKQKQVASLEKNVKGLKEREADLQQKLRTKEAQLVKKQAEIRGMQDKEKVLQSQLTRSAENMKTATDSIKLLLTSKEKLDKQMSEQRRKIADLAKESEQNAAKRDEIKKDLKVQVAKLDKMVDDNKDLERQLQSSAVELAVLRKTNEMIDKEREALRRQLAAKEGQISELQKSLLKAANADRFELWDKHAKSIYSLAIDIHRQGQIKANSYEAKLLAPAIALDNKTYLLSEFNSIGFGWSDLSQGQVDQLTIKANIKGNKTSTEITSPVLSINSVPKVCLLPCPAEEALSPIGPAELKKRGLHRLFLLKKDGASGKVKCHASDKSPGFVMASSEDKDFYSEPGDYLFTQDGKLVGIFVSYSACYVLPKSLKGISTTPIPISKQQGPTPFKVFSDTVNALKKNLK